MNIQDELLDQLQLRKVPATLYLISGIKLQGLIVKHDNFTVLLVREGHSQLVYKHAIATIASNRPLLKNSINYTEDELEESPV